MKARRFFSLIKFEHTVFAFPFAIMAAFLAAHGCPSVRQLGLIALAMVGARSAAMAFNRIVDLEQDSLNPRTKSRELPTGKVTVKQAWAIVIGVSLIFLLAATLLNRLTGFLAPLALSIILLYSYTKRYTTLSHLVLGLCLAIAPMGAWIAVKGRFGLPPFFLSAAVVFWVAGFDIIYSCQDVDFDRRQRLLSLPASLGIAPALWLARFFHLAVIVILLLLPLYSSLGLMFKVGVAVTAVLLLYEHTLVSPRNLSRVNAAFFVVNGCVSLLLMAFTLCDLLVKG
jgi:4-hydroxybenzoate polyprenyltransferase